MNNIRHRKAALNMLDPSLLAPSRRAVKTALTGIRAEDRLEIMRTQWKGPVRLIAPELVRRLLLTAHAGLMPPLVFAPAAMRFGGKAPNHTT